jgi:hypothetical protein
LDQSISIKFDLAILDLESIQRTLSYFRQTTKNTGPDIDTNSSPASHTHFPRSGSHIPFPPNTNAIHQHSNLQLEPTESITSN